MFHFRDVGRKSLDVGVLICDGVWASGAVPGERWKDRMMTDIGGFILVVVLAMIIAVGYIYGVHLVWSLK